MAPVHLAPRPTVAGLAIASMVLGILWIWWIGSILAVIFGHIALTQIKRANGWKTGRGMAIAGVVLGWIGVATLVIVLVAAIVGVGDEDAQRAAVDTYGPVEDDLSVLNGVYRLEWTQDELVAAGVPEAAVRDFYMAGVFTWSLDDGELAFLGKFPDGSILDCGGTYGITAERLELQRDPPCTSWRFTATWELTEAGLVFSDPLLDGNPEPLLEVWMAEKPWTKVR